jgi:hypothetical protein
MVPTNPLIGEVPLVAGGKTYTLRFGPRGLKQLERDWAAMTPEPTPVSAIRLAESVVNRVQKDALALSETELHVLLRAGLVERHCDQIAEEHVVECIREAMDYPSCVSVVVSALVESCLFPREAGAKTPDPRKPRRR